MNLRQRRIVWMLWGLLGLGVRLHAQVVIQGDVIHTGVGTTITEGSVVITDGKISAIGKMESIRIPEGFEVLKAKVVTPGLIDAHCTVGLSGILNVEHDQDQLEHSSLVRPEI